MDPRLNGTGRSSHGSSWRFYLVSQLVSELETMEKSPRRPSNEGAVVLKKALERVAGITRRTRLFSHRVHGDSWDPRPNGTGRSSHDSWCFHLVSPVAVSKTNSRLRNKPSPPPMRSGCAKEHYRVAGTRRDPVSEAIAVSLMMIHGRIEIPVSYRQYQNIN